MYCRKMQNIFFYILAINSNQLIFFYPTIDSYSQILLYIKKVLAIFFQLYECVLKFYSKFIVALLRKLNLLKTFEKNATIISHHHVT